jgi:hypothetical protein
MAKLIQAGFFPAHWLAAIAASGGDEIEIP